MKYAELIEKKQHGTPRFPIEYYHLNKKHPRYVMPLHWHKEYEIIRVLSGSMTVYLNSERYELGGGDCVFIEGGCLKRGYPHSCIYECLVFDTALLNSGIERFSEGPFGDPLGAKKQHRNFISADEKQLQATIDALFSAVKSKGACYELQTLGLLYTLFYELHRSGHILQSQDRPEGKGIQTVMSLLKWIDAHVTEHITLADVARVAGLSEKYVCRIFREYTSKTVIDYVNERRIERACAQLMTSGITETAFNCGFNDLSYFCKTFKKHMGITPSQYKKAAPGES